MEINRLAFAGLTLGCLATAAGGAYLATRHNAADETLVSPAAMATSPADSAPAGMAAPVAESEGHLEPEPAAEAPAAAAPSTPPAPAAPRATTPAPRPAAPARPAPAPRRASAQVEPAPAIEPAVEPAAPVATAGGGSMWEPRPTVEPERPALPVEPPPPAEPVREFVDLVIPADSVLGLQIERTISSELAKREDRVEARVTRDVRVGDRVAIPAGALVHGSVTDVDPGGKVKERARLAVRFHTVVMADGSRLSLRTEQVVREGQSPAGASAAKVGGAALGGAIIGGILGGKRGAAIGGSVGAAGGAAAVMSGDPNPAILAAGTTLTVRIQDPVVVTVEQ